MLHVFKYHGLPVDVVSDRGPQFTSYFWKAFCTHWCFCQFVLRVPSSKQWPDGAGKPTT
jgi:hypothetical protein